MRSRYREFLCQARARLHARHHALVEDVVFHFETASRSRRGRAPAAPTRAQLQRFLSVGVLRHPTAGSDPRILRTYVAATRLLVRGLTAAHSRQGRALRRTAARLGKQAVHAARAAAVLDACATRRPEADEGWRDEGHDALWQVVLCSGTHVALRSLQEGVVVGPVALPRDFVAALVPGVVIDLRLGRRAADWVVTAHGTCYPAEAVPVLRAEERHVL